MPPLAQTHSSHWAITLLSLGPNHCQYSVSVDSAHTITEAKSVSALHLFSVSPPSACSAKNCNERDLRVFSFQQLDRGFKVRENEKVITKKLS